MNIKFKVENPNSLEITLTMTATFGEFVALRDALAAASSENWTVRTFHAHLIKLVDEMYRVYWVGKPEDLK